VDAFLLTGNDIVIDLGFRTGQLTLAHACRAAAEQGIGNVNWILGADTEATNACGTDEASQRLYRDTLTAAGFDVTEASIDYADELDLEHLVGRLYSALSVQQLPPPDQRPAFAERVRRAVAPHERFTEHVRVRMLLGRAR
jgi:hypothetical protein